jgi:hypothetical protein
VSLQESELWVHEAGYLVHRGDAHVPLSILFTCSSSLLRRVAPALTSSSLECCHAFSFFLATAVSLHNYRDGLVIIGGVLLIFYIRAISRKDLIFGITDYLSVLNDLTTTSLRQHVTILYNAKAVSNLYTALLKIQNKGNTRIEMRDFHSKPVIFNLPREIKILDVAIKGKSQPNILIAEPKFKANNVSIEPFSLAVQEWFNIRLTFEFNGLDVIEKLKEIKIEEVDIFAFNVFRDDDWEERFEKQTRRRDTMLSIMLLILSALSIAIYLYVWFFPSSINLLSLSYQLLLTFGISILYFGLVVSMIINSITPKPSV